MANHLLSKTLSASLAAVLLGSVVASAGAVPSAAIEYIPGDNKQHDDYLGKPLAGPEDVVTYATGEQGTFERVRLFTTDNRPVKELKIVPLVKLPAGSFVYYDKNINDWYLYLPTTNAIPRTQIFYNLIDKDRRWSRTGHVVEVTPTPRPLSPPAEDEVHPNRGPEVSFRGASFPVGQEYEIHVMIRDPDHDDLKYSYLRADAGFRLEHMDDINWKLIIEPNVKPGVYEIGIQGEDVHGNRGEEVFTKIEMLAPGEKPKVIPGPGPGVPTYPQENPA